MMGKWLSAPVEPRLPGCTGCSRSMKAGYKILLQRFYSLLMSNFYDFE
jgi:hypothetical protein